MEDWIGGGVEVHAYANYKLRVLVLCMSIQTCFGLGTIRSP